MKKVLLSLLLTLGMIVAVPATTLAATPQTDITGNVTNNGKPVVGAKVTVECDNNAKKDTTDASGAYLVTFKATDCPVGATVNVIAKKGTKGGYSSKTVSGPTTKLNVVVVNVALPELGLITGGLALVAAVGGLVVIRRRHLGQN